MECCVCESLNPNFELYTWFLTPKPPWTSVDSANGIGISAIDELFQVERMEQLNFLWDEDDKLMIQVDSVWVC